MKRPHSIDALVQTQRRKRKRKASSTIMAFFCPADKSGPRIPTLLREFEQTCNVPSHLNWLHLLQAACERQGCHVADCSTGDYFSQTHGAKTLVNGITMFLTYYVPRKVLLTSDDEWRQVLAALRTFHNFCVRRKYVKDDAVLMTALHKLRRFCICTIPDRLEQLARQKYWDTIEGSKNDLREEEEHTLGENGDLDTAGDTHEKHLSREAESEDLTDPYDGYESFLGDEEPLSVEQIMEDGWVIYTEDSDERGERCTAFLHLPADLAKLGMQGMSLSCMKLALRNGVWRPIMHDGMFVANAYPPDDVFYY